MKRNKRNIDDWIRQHLPRASKEDAESAGERVLARLHREFEDQIEKFSVEPPAEGSEPEPLTLTERLAEIQIEWKSPKKPLKRGELLALRAVYLLGDAYELSVDLKVEELSPNEGIGAHYSLEGLRYDGLIREAGWGFPPNKPRVAEPYFRITPAGRHALAEAIGIGLKELEGVKDPKDGLEDLA